MIRVYENARRGKEKKTQRREEVEAQKQFQVEFLFPMFILQSVLSYNESIGGLLINLLCGEQTRKSSL